MEAEEGGSSSVHKQYNSNSLNCVAHIIPWTKKVACINPNPLSYSLHYLKKPLILVLVTLSKYHKHLPLLSKLGGCVFLILNRLDHCNSLLYLGLLRKQHYSCNHEAFRAHLERRRSTSIHRTIIITECN